MENQIAQEWQTVIGAPFLYVAAAIFVMLMAWGLTHFIYRERLDSLGARLKLKEDQLTDMERRLASAKEAAQQPPPAPLSNNVAEHRAGVLRQLTQLFILSSDGISSRMMAGMELPPAEFLNAELARMGERWRVRNVEGAGAETYDA